MKSINVFFAICAAAVLGSSSTFALADFHNDVKVQCHMGNMHFEILTDAAGAPTGYIWKGRSKNRSVALPCDGYDVGSYCRQSRGIEGQLAVELLKNDFTGELEAQVRRARFDGTLSSVIVTLNCE